MKKGKALVPMISLRKKICRQWRNKGGGARGAAALRRRSVGMPMATFSIFFYQKNGWTIQANAGGPRCLGPTFGSGIVVDTDTCC